jgi:hypothetical protein
LCKQCTIKLLQSRYHFCNDVQSSKTLTKTTSSIMFIDGNSQVNYQTNCIKVWWVSYYLHPTHFWTPYLDEHTVVTMKGFILLITFGFAGMNILFVDNTDYIYILYCTFCIMYNMFYQSFFDLQILITSLVSSNSSSCYLRV